MYKKLKKLKGERFAQTLRNFHNGILEIPDLDKIVRHAGNDAEPLLPYLMSLLAANDDKASAPAPKDPFLLLEQAGYDAFHADTLEKQNSIKKYFSKGELLCTFNDSARYKNYHIVHAVKKNADQIRRKDFKGKEKRQDEYGTSVISIQMLKKGGFISIKNRYNHSVGACDNTFDSNPDNIIDGLSVALKDHFNVEFSVPKPPLPDNYVLMGDRIFKYHIESSNIYYSDQAWAIDGTIHTVDKGAGDALFDTFLFDNKSKTLKKIDQASKDSFADDFNRCYGGNKGLHVHKGNLTLDGKVLIGAEKSRIKTLDLPALTTMGKYCLSDANALTDFNAPALTMMGDRCLYDASALTEFNAPALTIIGDRCFYGAPVLTKFNAPALTTMGDWSLFYSPTLTEFNAPALTIMGDRCLGTAPSLTELNVPVLATMGDFCLENALALKHFEAPSLITMGANSLFYVSALMGCNTPLLKKMGKGCLSNAPDHIKNAVLKQVTASPRGLSSKGHTR